MEGSITLSLLWLVRQVSLGEQPFVVGQLKQFVSDDD